MKSPIRLTLMLASAFLLFTAQKCGSGKYEYEPTTSIEIAKTGCFGQCPTYVFSLKGDGSATFNGRRFVEPEGEHHRTYSADTTNMVFSRLIEADLYQYEREYTDNVTDLPTTYLTFEHEGKQKKIKLYYGYPEELGTIVEQLQEVALTKGWMEGKAPEAEQ
ncbi:DUF6438 domain-containing protein [Phaeodactylibacter sp.]|uniref:DUF6438 domain-containing protein n=1 Tax=Phaeodactylibacter sp. TaxID=1940289 RepID=UPI0025CF9307|nr:DUF6438 domain-containing protein [Phaeodactylibacter sp.]MCI4648262.1 DUF6438 domain-containing protein [Phaeodactylibacter sp.]MCI5091883.1 DUF6438 domain-containing protein [Phaeodactylibacter sp.]